MCVYVQCFVKIPMSTVFANDPGDLSSIQGWVIPKTQKMVLDAILLNTQPYKVRIKGKVEKSREWSSAPQHFRVVAIKKGAFGKPSTKVANFVYICMYKTGSAIKLLTRVDMLQKKEQPANQPYSNLQSFLLRWGTRVNEWSTQRDFNSL